MARLRPMPRGITKFFAPKILRVAIRRAVAAIATNVSICSRQQHPMVACAHQKTELRHSCDERVERTQRDAPTTSLCRRCWVAARHRGSPLRSVATALRRPAAAPRGGSARGSGRRFRDASGRNERSERVVEPVLRYDAGAADLIGFQPLTVRRGFVVRDDLCGERSSALDHCRLRHRDDTSFRADSVHTVGFAAGRR